MQAYNLGGFPAAPGGKLSRGRVYETLQLRKASVTASSEQHRGDRQR